MDDTPQIDRRFDPGFVAASENYQIIQGPSFLNGLPSKKEWLDFINNIENSRTREFAEVWREKSKALKGVPLRGDFDFKTLVKYGRNLLIYKLTEEGRWLTTFCGEGIVEETGLELTNKYIEEYADKKTLEYWMENIQLITEQCKPIYEIFTLGYSNKYNKVSCSLNLPLRSGTGKPIDMFFCHEFFLYL